MRYVVSLLKSQFGRAETCSTDPEVGYEIRLDSCLGESDFEHLSMNAATIVTYRTKHHGGLGDSACRDQQGWAWRKRCIELGAGYLDLEWDEPELARKIDWVRRMGARTILSYHNLQDAGFPKLGDIGDLIPRVDVVKWIGTGRYFADLVAQRELYRDWQGPPLISFLMGPEYLSSRVLSIIFGAPFTYVSAGEGHAVAPGQIDLETMRGTYAPFEIEPSRLRLFAVAGFPVGHSRSPAFHGPPLRTVDPNAMMVPLPGRNAETLRAMKRLFPELVSMAVTRPLKESAFDWANTRLEASGGWCPAAANTLVFGESSISWANTDRLAIMALLEPFVGLGSLRVLGFGGFGKAAVAAGLALGLKTEVCNRSPDRLHVDLPRSIKILPWSDRHETGPAILIQATSVGMDEDTSPVTHMPDSVSVVLESIYEPPETSFLTMARHQGCQIIDGQSMFNEQAKIQQRFFP